MKKKFLRNLVIILVIIGLLVVLWNALFKKVDKLDKEKDYIYTKVSRTIEYSETKYKLYDIKFNFESDSVTKVKKDIEAYQKALIASEYYGEANKCLTNKLDSNNNCLLGFYENDIKIYESNNYLSLNINYNYISLTEKANDKTQSLIYTFNKKDGALLETSELIKKFDINIEDTIKNIVIDADKDDLMGEREEKNKVNEIIDNNNFFLYVNTDNKLCIYVNFEILEQRVTVDKIVNE